MSDGEVGIGGWGLYGRDFPLVLPEFPHIAQVLNRLNGQYVKLNPPVEIHRDDVMWAATMIQEGIELDWRIEP